MKITISKSIIFSTVLLIVKTAPTEYANDKSMESTTAINSAISETLIKELYVISYIQNFKNSMTDYVLYEYKDLSVHEIEEIKNILEEFLTNFAADLKKSVEKQQKRDRSVKDGIKDKIEAKTEITSPVRNEDEIRILNEESEKLEALDGTSNAMFYDVKAKLRSEFPEINEWTAEEIVYHLRKNLYETRQKIDKVIIDSKRSKAEFAQDTRIEYNVSSMPVDNVNYYNVSSIPVDNVATTVS